MTTPGGDTTGDERPLPERGQSLSQEAEPVLLKAAFDHAPIAMAITDADGRYVRANRAMHELVGQADEELVGRAFQVRVHPDDLAAELAAMERLVNQEISSYEAENRRIHPERGIIWVRERVSLALDHVGAPLVPDEHGGPAYVIRQVMDITAEREWKAAVEVSREDAVRANQAKSEFLSRMSHELRTPLNAVLGFAQLLELNELTPGQQDAVAHIIKGGRHLLDLINEVLDIARIESGNLALSPEPVQMTQAVAETLDLVRPLAASSGIALPDGPGPCAAFVVADLSRLKQVLLNLLANGIKYNRPGGSVTITCEVIRDGWGRISITDTGVGIPSDKLPLLFTPFERLGAEQSEVEGTGVGLALSRRLVEAMGGMLSVDTAPGQGSTFWLELPLAAEPATQTDATGNAVGRSQPKIHRRARILYIEDNLSNLRLMERLFDDAELLSAMQGELGIVLARQHRPDLVLLDLHLPDIPGEQVLRRLGADPATARVPIVAVSADATPGRVRRILALGARTYLTKPLNVRELLHVVAEILNEREDL